MSDLEKAIEAIAERVAERVVRRILAERDAKPEKLTVAEYARRWSLGQSTVRAAIREGRLEHVRIGRAVRIPADAHIRGRRDDVDETTRRAQWRLIGNKGRPPDGWHLSIEERVRRRFG